MARIRQKSTRRTSARGGCWKRCAATPGWVCLLLFALQLPGPVRAAEPLSEDPVVWYATDDQPSEVPAFAEPGLMPYAIESFLARPFSRFWHPGRFFRRLGTGDRARPAANVNALDEVVNSTWFTNRIGLRPLSTDELRFGPGCGLDFRDGPDRSGPWTIIGAKTAGVTPGFRVKDARGDTWLLKFDPVSHPGMTIRSGVVANLILHAIGYNTPVDRVVIFDRQDLVVGEGARMKIGRSGKVPMTDSNLDSLLTATGSIFDGRYHALASRYLDGVPLGPFDDQDLRTDDTNDLIKHENRRELRGLRVFAAWLNHFDTKMHNSLDMYVGEPGKGHVRHYLIDFASTLGAYGDLPVQRFGYEFGLDMWPMIGRFVTAGLVEDPWVKLQRPPGLSEVGLFDVETFAVPDWKPDLPHSGMANLTSGDGYWAAKILSAFTDADLQILVEQGHYQNPAAVAFLVKTLAGRRDKLVRYWFDEIPPLDFFQTSGHGVTFTDLAIERGYASANSTSYRYRVAVVDSERRVGERTKWQDSPGTTIDLVDKQGQPLSGVPQADARYTFLTIEVQLNRGSGWSPSTTATFSLVDGHTVAVER